MKARPRDLLTNLWKLWPDTFAERASGGKWVAYPWLKYVSKRITPALVNGGGRFIITAPPQHGKSEFISRWVPTWYLNLFQDRKIILATYAAEYAQKWGSAVRENLTENDIAKVPLRWDTKSKKKFMTKAGGQMMVAGIGGPATGEGCHVLICDDAVKNYEEALSPRIQERNLNWYRTVARTRMQENATVIILQTRWHENDLAGALAEEGGFEVINLPAICDDPAGDPLCRLAGEALCPERYSANTLADIRKDVGELIWSAMFQGAPVNQGGNIVQGSWVQFYRELPRDMEEIAIFADLAYKDGEENDFTCVEAWGRKGPNIYLIDQIHARLPFPDQIGAIVRMCEAHPDAYHKEIEEKANGAALIQVVKEAIPGIVANNPKTSKEARLAAVSTLYKAGNVWYPHPDIAPWVKANMKELTGFPRVKNDDTVDVASMALSHLGRMSSFMKRMESLGKW
jgi:predicted phage terminase large subunit-like protein